MSLTEPRTVSQPPSARKPSAIFTWLKLLWWCVLAFLCLMAVVVGLNGNMSGFWLVAVFGLPTIWLQRKWAVRAKASGTAIFAALFLCFGVYSATPRGRAAHAAELRGLAQQEKHDATARQAAERQVAKEQVRQKAIDAKREAEQQAKDTQQAQKQKAQDAAQQAQEELAAQSTSEAKMAAYVTAQDAINQLLKAPKTADYPDYEDGFVQRIGDNTYRVAAYVDSQNSYGAILRARWSVVVRKGDGDNWGSKDAIINER